jgi:hypothetical protein
MQNIFVRREQVQYTLQNFRGGSRRYRGEAGAYGKGLRKMFTQKNLARRQRGEKMVVA